MQKLKLSNILNPYPPSGKNLKAVAEKLLKNADKVDTQNVDPGIRLCSESRCCQARDLADELTELADGEEGRWAELSVDDRNRLERWSSPVSIPF